MQKTKTIAAQYVITENCISIYRSDAVGFEFIHSSHPLFDALKTFLPRSAEFDVDVNKIDSTQLIEIVAKQQYPDLMAACEDFPLDSALLATLPAIAKRIKSMQAANIPTQPLVAFWQKLTASALSFDKIEALLDVVGTTALPLTWDGNLIAYRRGGFTDVPRLDLPAWVPGAFTGNKPIVNQQLQPLNAVMNTCADLGVLNEALVFPQQILDFSGGKITVRSCSFLGKVPENYLERCSDRGLVEVDTQIDGFGNLLYVRRPIDRDMAIAAASLSSAYSDDTNIGYTQELAVSLSC